MINSGGPGSGYLSRMEDQLRVPMKFSLLEGMTYKTWRLSLPIYVATYGDRRYNQSGSVTPTLIAKVSSNP